MWIDGNNSTNTSWENLATANFELQSHGAAPAVRNSRFNFHRELNFGNSANSKLRTTVNYPVTADIAGHYAFVVSERDGAATEQILLTYIPAGGTSAANLRDIRRRSLQWNGSNIRVGWSNVTGTTAPTMHSLTNAQRFGIASKNITNGGASSIFMNGTAHSFTASPAGGVTTGRLTIGNGHSGTGNSLGFTGSIQEVIVMRGNRALNEIELAQIHSYLAIKYGITLNVGDYRASDGSIVWDRTANAGFNYHIFGIARDELSGLDQRQARSATNPHLTVFLGSMLTTLNSQNTARLAEDMQYMMIGNDGTSAIRQLTGVFQHTGYRNGNIDDSVPFNLRSSVYKTQLTGMNSIEVNLMVSADFAYALVSSSPNFEPANTYFYPVSSVGIAEVRLTDEFRYIKFVGFAPGPGGVTSGLRMWLRADDEVGLGTLELSATTDNRTTGVANVTTVTGGTVTGVTSWSDMARNRTFTHAQAGGHATGQGTVGGSSVARRIPILEQNHPEKNFQPAVRFWQQQVGGGATTHANLHSAFLAAPANMLGFTERAPEHSVIMVVNNNLEGTTRNEQNILWFSGDRLANAAAAWAGPGYALMRVASGEHAGTGRGRFRGGQGGEWHHEVAHSTVEQRLFIPNTTTILSYNVAGGAAGATNTAANRIPMYFRFNGRESGRTLPRAGSYDIRSAVTLGAGNNNLRAVRGMISEVIIFDRILTGEDTQRVESYLALKYGITLRPERLDGAGSTSTTGIRPNDGVAANDFGRDHNPNTTGRFNYVFSNNQPIWLGETNPCPRGNDERFYNNIAAVIRDDVARLHNRQAHSTDAGSIVHMGVAGVGGARLTFDGSTAHLGKLENNLEAVVWGSNLDTEFYSNGNRRPFMTSQEEDCGEFTQRFSRIWRVLKHTQDNRPIEMLVGARNNLNLTFGQAADANTRDYYNVLTEGHDVFLIIAASPDHLTENNFRPLQIIPMTRTEGLHQAIYTFSQEETFFTFGFRRNANACFGSEENSFSGIKTFNWSQWTSRTNLSNTFGPHDIRINAPVDLGDNIIVTETRVHSPTSDVCLGRGFPRNSHGWLEVRRRGRNTLSMGEVTVAVNFNAPVVPEFQISGIDGRSRSFDNVEIIGRCAGGELHPALIHATGPNRRTTFRIQNNRAVVPSNTPIMVRTNRNGMVNVVFETAVEEIIIRYRLTGRAAGTQRIFISPITLRSWDHFLPPPVNADGLSFMKRADVDAVNTCEMVAYSFFIQNTNCHDVPVTLTDMLPPGMKFVAESLAVGEANSEENNPYLAINEYEGTRELRIENLIIPAESTLRVMITAEFEVDAPSGTYTNEAQIVYYSWDIDMNGNPIPTDRRVTVSASTSISVTAVEQPQKISMEVTANRASYRENTEVEFTVTINNPNQDILDSYLDFIFNEHFTLVPSSVDLPPGSDLRLILDPDGDRTFFSIAGLHFESANPPEGSVDGFTLPAGETVIRFRVLAPSIEYIDFVVDEKDQLTNQRTPMVVDFSFSTFMDDPCVIAVSSIEGIIYVPYANITHIRINRHLVPAPLR